MKQTIILLYGGRSAEREVSVLSAESVMRAVNYDRSQSRLSLLVSQVTLLKRKNLARLPVKRIVL